MLQKYPDYEQEVKIPEKEWPLRIWYMHGQDVCTLIDVNEQERKIKIRNYTDKIMFRAFGVVENPDYNQYRVPGIKVFSGKQGQDETDFERSGAAIL